MNIVTHYMRFPVLVVTNGIDYIGDLKVGNWSASEERPLVAGYESLSETLLPL